MICPACHADRQQVAEMLAEPPVLSLVYRGWDKDYYRYLETENRAMARVILQNCPSCRVALASKLQSWLDNDKEKKEN